jgi:hypothetical protein
MIRIHASKVPLVAGDPRGILQRAGALQSHRLVLPIDALNSTVDNKMKPLPDVQMRVACPPPTAFRRLAEATAEEGFPFLSPTRPPDRTFLYKRKGSGFRLWKWPSKSRHANKRIPILHAEVLEEGGCCVLTGSFRLHPFARFQPWFIAVVMFGIAVAVWFEGRGLAGKLFALFFVLMSVFSLASAFQDVGRQQAEEEEIVQFLDHVFADAKGTIPGTPL